jgi:hypothetical protein
VIVQRETRDFVLIRQSDHAALAADLMGAWTAGGLLTNPRRDWILAAARAHDDGWDVEDEAMIVDADGAPVDFIAASLAVKHGVWPRCLAQLDAGPPYVAALVAQHALTVYGDHRAKPEWQPFFETMAMSRAALLARCDPETAAHIDADYRFVRMADILSLIFCKGWRQPFEHDGHRIAVDDGVLGVAPDPFNDARIPIAVTARRIPRRAYTSDADLRSAIAAASVVMIEGTAVGPTHSDF